MITKQLYFGANKINDGMCFTSTPTFRVAEDYDNVVEARADALSIEVGNVMLHICMKDDGSYILMADDPQGLHGESGLFTMVKAAWEDGDRHLTYRMVRGETPAT